MPRLSHGRIGTPGSARAEASAPLRLPIADPVIVDVIVVGQVLLLPAK